MVHENSSFARHDGQGGWHLVPRMEEGGPTPPADEPSPAQLDRLDPVQVRPVPGLDRANPAITSFPEQGLGIGSLARCAP